MRYSFSQLMQEIFQLMQGLRAKVYKHTLSEQNEAEMENFSTAGGTLLANFFVAPPQRAISTGLVVAPRTSTQKSFLQLSKKSIS